MGDTVTTIDPYMFGGMNALSTVIIPNSVTAIGSDAFANTPNLQQVIFDEDSPFECVNNYVIKKSNGNAVSPFGTVTGAYAFPTIPIIASYALEDNQQVTSITVPSGVYSIG